MSPWTRLVAGGLFPLHERLKGHHSVAHRRALEASQWWPADRLAALQVQRLQALLHDVATRVPYYRRLFRAQGLTPEQFRTLDDLARLPVTDKALIRAQGQDWLAEGATGLVRQRTSGSSGEPLTFWLSKDRISLDIAAKWRATRWWDVDIGDRELVLWGSAVENQAQNRLRAWRDRLMRSRLVPAQALDGPGLDRVIEQIQRFRPRMLFGYPSALSRVAWRAREQGRRLDDLGIRVAFTTSEVLRPEWRGVIGEVLGCGVANEYGARDAGFIARECPAGGLHVSAEYLIVEVLDDADQPVPPGEAGHLVVTTLAGPEFPFLRYRTGDRGALDTTPCPCGRGLPRLSRLEGRANDGLLAWNGAWVHGSRFNYLLRELDGLRAYKIVQHRRDAVEVLLSADPPPDEGFEQRLRMAFADALGPEVGITLRRVDAVPPEPNGKHRHVVCRVDAG